MGKDYPNVPLTTQGASVMINTSNYEFCYFHKLLFPIPSTKKVLDELTRYSFLWNEHTLRTQYTSTSHREVSDILLRFHDLKELPIHLWENEVFNGNSFTDYPAMKILRSIRPIMNTIHYLVEGEGFGKAMVTKLPPGGSIDWHTDEGDTAKQYDRFHVVLQEGGLFFCGDETIIMKNQEVWWFDNQAPHSVDNDSDHDRIHLILDIKLSPDSPFYQFKNHGESQV